MSVSNKQANFDLLGNVALVKFKKGATLKYKKSFTNKLLKNNSSIKTVLEKTGKFKGRLRRQTTRYIAGEKTKEALYRENDAVFRFNVDNSYFSPRLSNERKEVAKKIKKSDLVLVMFAGVAPYPIVIAKHSKAKVYSNEINREANKYAELNIELNKLKGKVVLIPGDVKRVSKKIKQKFDVIVMPRPQLKDMFLKEAFSLSKKGTRIFYYDFCKQDQIKNVVERVKLEAKKSGKKISILRVKRAGEIAPYTFRIRIDMKLV